MRTLASYYDRGPFYERPTTYQHSNDKRGLWVTKDYLIVDYTDLEDSHLANICNVLYRSAREYQYPRLFKLARRRGLWSR